MKTKSYNFIHKPKYISIHKWKGDNYYQALQWSDRFYTRSKYTIGVWHIKYKDIDCNFS